MPDLLGLFGLIVPLAIPASGATSTARGGTRCASRDWSQSYPTRRWFLQMAVSDVALIFWMAGRSRANRPIPHSGQVPIVAWVFVGSAAIGTYNHQIKRFWDEILVDWEAHERMLDEDPRNALAG